VQRPLLRVAQGGAPFQWNLLAWAALVGGSQAVLPWWAFTFCWASPTGSFRAWSRG